MIIVCSGVILVTPLRRLRQFFCEPSSAMRNTCLDVYGVRSSSRSDVRFSDENTLQLAAIVSIVSC